MARSAFTVLAILALATFASAPAFAGAFTLAEGEAKIFLSGLYTAGDAYFDGRGKRRARDVYRKSDLQLFAEYGLSDRFTAFGSTALQKIDVSDYEGSDRKGLGRSEIGLRARLYQSGGWTGSVQGSVVIAGAKKGEGAAAIGEADDQVDLRGLVARSFELFGRHGFIDLQAGYRTRSGDPADEIRADATLGLRIAPRWLLMAQSFNTFGVARWSGPYPLRQRIHKVQGALLFDLTKTLVIFGGVFATPIGRDAMDERGGTLGIGYRF
jgi:hypothetical protein